MGFGESKPNQLDNNSINDKLDSKKDKEKIRKETWNEIFINYDEYRINQFNLLKIYTLKGIPDIYREVLWQKYTNNCYYKKDPNLSSIYNTYVSELSDDDKTIFKDIDRTFPGHNLFKDKYANGQKSLYKVLSAYSKYNKEVGYVQGMGFICGVFLTYLDEESTFWQIHTLMKNPKYGLQDLYSQGFPKLKLNYYVYLSLLKEYMIEVYNHLVYTFIINSFLITLYRNVMK